MICFAFVFHFFGRGQANGGRKGQGQKDLWQEGENNGRENTNPFSKILADSGVSLFAITWKEGKTSKDGVRRRVKDARHSLLAS